MEYRKEEVKRINPEAKTESYVTPKVAEKTADSVSKQSQKQFADAVGETCFRGVKR